MPDLTAYIRQCGSCDAPIVWARTISGRTMPVDAEPGDGGNVFLELRQGLLRAYVVPQDGTPFASPVDFHTSHFVTCPDADAWRPRYG